MPMNLLKPKVEPRTGAISSQLHLTINLNRPQIHIAQVDDIAITGSIGYGVYGHVQKGLYEGQPVAVKTLRVVDTKLFATEIQELYALNAPCLVRLRAVADVSSQHPKVLYDMIDHGALSNYIHKPDFSSLEEDKKLQIALDIARGLEHLHQRGRIHGDLRPQNVMLADIAITSAKLVHFDTAQSFPWMYAAPEVLNGEKANPPADIYSFGVLLTAIETNSNPLANHRTNFYAAIKQVIEGKLRPKCTSACASWLATLTEECLSLDPNKRPSANSVVATIVAKMPKKPQVIPVYDNQWYNPQEGVKVQIFKNNDYTLVNTIGSGRAGNTRLCVLRGKTVVLRFVDDASDFEQTVKIMSMLDNIPTLVKLLGVSDVDAKYPNLLVEYVDGSDLRNYLYQKLRSQIEISFDPLDIALTIITTLQTIHSAGIIYRNLNSMNVLLDHTTMQTKLNIVIEPSGSFIFGGINAQYWAAPEVITDSKYSIKSDIYSFGVILTELDTYQPPFGSSTLSNFQKVYAIIEDNLRPELNLNCEEWYRNLANACMHQDPDLRPTTEDIIQILKTQQQAKARKRFSKQKSRFRWSASSDAEDSS
ncbi:serine/threonineprotein kinase [Thraustotheca clavata]|uniref:Serine/threonineprotein kinase n=1 Tax=Thraustotheca clavata TaxID=74557 RepID=A0A1V9YXB6_9STRA|nr:serine/threonineprotein kinase [Thraustotheca clavata]